jgi:hypothetical protein
MNRVRAILLANSGLGLLKRPSPRRAVWSLRRDGLRLLVATAFVAAALAALYSVVGDIRLTRIPIDEAAVARRIQAEVEARRVGSILFLSSDRLCEEHQFDNRTGNTMSIEMVDCAARLERGTSVELQAAKAAGLQNMFSSFRK